MSLESEDTVFESVKSADSTVDSVKRFYEKVLPSAYAIFRNSKYFAAKSALKYIKTDNEENKTEAKEWLNRSEKFKIVINSLKEDPLMSKELIDTYKISEED